MKYEEENNENLRKTTEGVESLFCGKKGTSPIPNVISIFRHIIAIDPGKQTKNSGGRTLQLVSGMVTRHDISMYGVDRHVFGNASL
jgi:hypothetical protein